MLHYCDLYDPRVAHDRRQLVVDLLQALGAAALVMAVLYYLLPQLIVGRGIGLMATVFLLVFIMGWRLLYLEWLSAAPRADRAGADRRHAAAPPSTSPRSCTIGGTASAWS